MLKNERLLNKIDNRWGPQTYEVVEQSNLNLPVYKVKNSTTGVTKLKHRNQLLLIFRSYN